MNKTEIDNLIKERNWYKSHYYRLKEERGDDRLSGHSIEHQRELRSLKNLKHSLKTVDPNDFTRSDIVCDCGRQGRHHKLQYSSTLVCPFVLTIQFHRLNLMANADIKFNVVEIIKRAK